MKITQFVIAAVLTSSVANSNAQGFLKKLADKANAGNKKEETKKVEEKKVMSPQEIAYADSANTFLDSKEILKDSRGMSGIYYANTLIDIDFDLSNEELPAPFAKKFLINYDESTPNHVLSINTQYAYETTDRTKFVKRAEFYMTSYDLTILKKSGVFWTGEDNNVANSNYRYATHTKKEDLQGNPILGNDVWVGFTGTILEAEPGILLLGSIYQDDYKKEINYSKKFKVLVVLYKADKSVAAKKYTNDYAWDKVAEMANKSDNVDASTGSLPAEYFKDAKLNAEALAFAKASAAKNHPNEQVQYTYIGAKDWNIMRNKTTGIIVKRTMSFIVVVKIGTKCAYEFASIEQLYDGSAYGKSLWKDAGAPQYIDCAGMNKYK